MTRAAWRILSGLPVALFLTAACVGLLRGDYYAGRSSGDLDACTPFDFDVSIEEGGRIMGVAATTHPWGTVSWNVVGMVEGGEVILETRTEDPRVSERLRRWRGRRGAVSLQVTEEGAAGCLEPRAVTLYRK